MPCSLLTSSFSKPKLTLQTFVRLCWICYSGWSCLIRAYIVIVHDRNAVGHLAPHTVVTFKQPAFPTRCDITGYHPNYFLLIFRASPLIPTSRISSCFRFSAYRPTAQSLQGPPVPSTRTTAFCRGLERPRTFTHLLTTSRPSKNDFGARNPSSRPRQTPLRLKMWGQQ